MLTTRNHYPGPPTLTADEDGTFTLKFRDQAVRKHKDGTLEYTDVLLHFYTMADYTAWFFAADPGCCI